MKRGLLITAALLAAHAATAAPKGAKARQEFERGVKAYQKQDYPAAAAAFEDSWRDEQDVETLFAWAQAERLQNHCDVAIDLYKKLDKFNLNAENRQLIVSKKRECQEQIAAQKPPDEPVVHDPPEQPPPHDEPEPPDHPDRPEHRKRPHREAGHWYEDALGDSLMAVGLVGLGAGTGLLVASHDDAQLSSTYGSAKTLGVIGESAGAVGLAGVILGLWRYSSLPGDPPTTVTGWASPHSGGLAVTGSF